MKAESRRKDIITILLSERKPVSGGEIARRLGVSRQIIVQDIAALKNAGNTIIPTHKGYLIQNCPYIEKTFKVRHSSEQTVDELMTIVELGGTILNVFVWHKIYGRIEASLDISSRSDIERLSSNLNGGKSIELMHITSGYHYHTVSAGSEEILNEIEAALKRKNYIVPEI